MPLFCKKNITQSDTETNDNLLVSSFSDKHIIKRKTKISLHKSTKDKDIVISCVDNPPYKLDIREDDNKREKKNEMRGWMGTW